MNRENKMNILVVDDDETLSFMIKKMLDNYGYRATLAGSSEAAFALQAMIICWTEAITVSVKTVHSSGK